MACLGAIEQLGWPLDRIVTAEVWATDTILADLPPMVEFKTKIYATLQVIAIALFLLLFFKDMSGQYQLRGIKEELKRIADALERREQDG